MRKARVVTIAMFLLIPTLAGAVFAQKDAVPADWQTAIEKKLSKTGTFEFQDTTLTKALDFIRRMSELNVILDTSAADLAEKHLTLKLRKVRVESAIAWTARLMGLDYAVRDEAIYLARRDDMPVDWRGEMQERYRKMVADAQAAWLLEMEARLDRTVKVDFRGDQLPAVIEYLATQSDLNIVLDYHLVGATKPVKLEAEMTVRNVLNWVTKLAEVRYVIRDEVIYVAGKDAMETLHLETGESPLSILFRRPVSFDFTQTPVRDALEQLSRYSGVKINLQGLEGDEKLPVTARADAVELNRAVRIVMDQTGRAYAVSFTGKSISVMLSPKPKTGKVSLDTKKPPQ
jgi:hypothetical protein